MRKHAPGSPVAVHLDYEPDAVRLTVRNAAAPRPTRPAPTGGHGLAGLRERVGLAGGTVTRRTGRRRMARRCEDPRMITVVVADDQTVVREGLVVLLGLLDDVEVVGAAGDGEEAVELVAAHCPRRRADGPADAALRRGHRDRADPAPRIRGRGWWC